MLFKRDNAISAFRNSVDFAKDLASKNPLALVDLVRVLARPLQSEFLVDVIRSEPRGVTHLDELNGLFFKTSRICDFERQGRIYDHDVVVKLNRDPVFPVPWNRDRMASALATIGSGKSRGLWRQDTNHGIKVWLPWGLCFVMGGESFDHYRSG